MRFIILHSKSSIFIIETYKYTKRSRTIHFCPICMNVEIV